MDQIDSDGRTPLINAINSFDYDIKKVLTLIETSDDINHQDKGQHWSAMHYAARDQKLDVVQALIKAGADLKLGDVFGNTPLWRAVSTVDQDLSTVVCLLEAGADPTIKNKTPLSVIEFCDNAGIDNVLALFKKSGYEI